MSTIYASFIDSASAERAAGALLDQGAVAEDLSIVSGARPAESSAASEQVAKTGITTTTPDDVAVGAAKGASVGVTVGVLATVAALFVPGLGLIVGGGALATALAGGAATILAGTAAGAVVGYLKDQGVPEDVATRYSNDFIHGGSILAIAIPSGALTGPDIESILAKYGAMNVATYNSVKVLVDDPAIKTEKVPLVIDNPNIDPIATTAVVIEPEPPRVTQVVDASTGETQVVIHPDEPAIAKGDPVLEETAPDVKLI